MPKRFSDVMGVTTEELWAEGAFDAFVDIDSRFHIDPHLLEKTNVPELQGAYQKVLLYFEDILLLLAHSERLGDFYFQRAEERLHFPELRFLSLGHTKGERKNRAKGKGVGPELAKKLTETAVKIVKAGIVNPRIFELVGLFEKDMGADRISDMIARIIIDNLLAFTERVSKNLNLTTHPFPSQTRSYLVPFDPENQESIIFVPHEILRSLPAAFDWTEVDLVMVYNEELRQALNGKIGISWKDATNQRKITKEKLAEIVLADRKLIDDLLTQYEDKPASRYDFDKDPEGQIIWYRQALEWAARHPDFLTDTEITSSSQVLVIVQQMCRKFGELLQRHSLKAILIKEDGRFRKEVYARLLFYGLAEIYCEANNLDINLKAQWGRELVEFKIGRGYKKNVYVSVKYSRNSHLPEQYQTAVDEYEAREGDVVYVVIRTAESKAVLESLEEIRDKALADNKPTPALYIFDGRMDEAANGRLWEMGIAESEVPKQIEETYPEVKESTFPAVIGKDDEKVPLGIRAKKLRVRVGRLQRIERISGYIIKGLTANQMAELEDIDPRTVRSDISKLREWGEHPLENPKSA